MSKHKNKKKSLLSGITLIELLVSVTLFVVIVLSATQIFAMVLQSQRRVIAIQNVQESLKYFFEVTSKEIRMAVRNVDDEQVCNLAHINENQIFGLVGDSTLYLRNYRDDCVKYYLDNNRFMVERGGVAVALSPNEIIIDSLKFIVEPRTDNSQAYVTINVSAKSIGKDDEVIDIQLQTTIASRYYRSN